ncbi:hypothetical protein EW146_g9721, partial [Bondarzewia mesenterica]
MFSLSTSTLVLLVAIPVLLYLLYPLLSLFIHQALS